MCPFYLSHLQDSELNELRKTIELLKKQNAAAQAAINGVINTPELNCKGNVRPALVRRPAAFQPLTQYRAQRPLLGGERLWLKSHLQRDRSQKADPPFTCLPLATAETAGVAYPLLYQCYREKK